MKNLNIYYNGPINDKMDKALESLLKKYGYKFMASGYSFMDNERVLSFLTSAGTKRRTTQKQ